MEKSAAKLQVLHPDSGPAKHPRRENVSLKVLKALIGLKVTVLKFLTTTRCCDKRGIVYQTSLRGERTVGVEA